MKKDIAIIGSTGSIGRTLLNIIDKKNHNIILLAANKNYQKILKQAVQYNVKNLIITNQKCYVKALKLTKNKNPLERKFLGFGIIDLTLYFDQVKSEYNYYRNLVCEGRVNKFTSSAKVLGKNQILHVRTAGTRKYRNYTTKQGITYSAKPYNFTLDYKVIDKLIKPLM